MRRLDLSVSIDRLIEPVTIGPFTNRDLKFFSMCLALDASLSRTDRLPGV